MAKIRLTRQRSMMAQRPRFVTALHVDTSVSTLNLSPHYTLMPSNVVDLVIWSGSPYIGVAVRSGKLLYWAEADPSRMRPYQ